MRYLHIGAVVTVALAIGLVGCRKDRQQAGVTYYPSPTVVVPAAPAPAPQYPPSIEEYAPPPPQPAPLPPAPAPAVSPVAPATGSAIAQEVQGEVLTRGPLHEAFAEVINYNPQPGMVAPKAPLASIEEVPPDERPSGAVWIPGYWAWDDDRQDFLWVSGIWRVPPPNVGWVPGYWTQTAQGWQWTTGFWKSNPAQEITYLPPPPTSLELGPSSPPPSEDHIWVTGCWTWGASRYAWRPGYWMVARPSWVWVPAYYVWTPRGYVFVGGYWDYSMKRRGIVFAPVYFPPSVFYVGRPVVYYSPTVVIDTGMLTFSLFARPRYCHYYFGDYYDLGYVQAGIYPWYAFNYYHTWYDPIYEHRRWDRRHDDPRWSEHVRQQYEHLRDTPSARPSRTFAAEQALWAKTREPLRPVSAIGRPLAEVVAAKNTDMKFEKLDRSNREEIARHARDLEKYRGQRAAWEVPPAATKPTKEVGTTPGPLTGRPGTVTPPAQGVTKEIAKQNEKAAKEAAKQAEEAAKRAEKAAREGKQPVRPTAPTTPTLTRQPQIPTPPATKAGTVTAPPVVSRDAARQNEKAAKETAKLADDAAKRAEKAARENRQPMPPTVTPPTTSTVRPPTSTVRPPTTRLPPTTVVPAPPSVVMPTGPKEPVRVRVPEPPIVSRPPDVKNRDMQPPPRPDVQAPPTVRRPAPALDPGPAPGAAPGPSAPRERPTRGSRGN